jgi:hypothetical protein
MRGVSLMLGFTLCAGSFGCGTSFPLPSLSLHALSQLTRSRSSTETRRARNFLLLVQLTFQTRAANTRRPRTPLELDLLSIGWEALPDACEDAGLCEWARLAEESSLSALGVAP